MKKFLFTAAMAAMAIVSASAQTGINQTTLWTFDQFQNNDIVSTTDVVNYGDLYIVGHNEKNPATIKSKSGSSFSFGDYKYYVNYYLTIPGNALDLKKTKPATAIDQDAVAFDAATAGTTYVAYLASKADANRGIKPYFNGTEVTTTESGTLTSNDAKNISVVSFKNSEAGTVAITSADGSVYIYAVKFVPASETTTTKEITLGKYGVNTFSDTHAWKIPEGLKAFYAAAISDDGTKLGLTEIKDNIPACMGVILQGNANTTYTLTSTDTASTERRAGKGIDINYALRPVISTDGYALPATDLTTNTSKDPFHNFIIADGGNAPVFAPAAAGTIAAGKAYYSVRADKDNFASSGTSASAKGINLPLDFTTTGISEVKSEELKVKNQNVYNLAGQRVGKDYKGVVIINGKKYIQK